MINKTNPIEALALIGNQQPNAKTVEGKPMSQVSPIALALVANRHVKIDIDKSLPVIKAYLKDIRKRSIITCGLVLGTSLAAAYIDYKNKANKSKKRKA